MQLHLIDVGGGRLSVGHRPGAKLLRPLKEAGVTHTVTLLSESEGADELMARLRSSGFETLSLALAGAEPPTDPALLTEVRALYQQLEELLADGASIYIHCSAGIHRTGMITNGFLHHLGMTSEQAQKKLGELRQVTLDGVTGNRLQWGHQFATQ